MAASVAPLREAVKKKLLLVTYSFDISSSDRKTVILNLYPKLIYFDQFQPIRKKHPEKERLAKHGRQGYG
jgi:hypothetical protein